MPREGPGAKVKLPPWGVKLGPDEDRLIKKPGKAEEELASAIEQGKWNDLTSKSRLWLLRAFAVEHTAWPDYTPRCQMWVLFELGRLLAEEPQEQPPLQETYQDSLSVQTIMKDRRNLLEALEQTRVGRIVNADPKRARELSFICEESLSMQKAVNLLQVELANMSQREQRTLMTEKAALARVQTPLFELHKSRSDAALQNKAATSRSPKAMQKSSSETTLRKPPEAPAPPRKPPPDVQLAPIQSQDSKVEPSATATLLPPEKQGGGGGGEEAVKPEEDAAKPKKKGSEAARAAKKRREEEAARKAAEKRKLADAPRMVLAEEEKPGGPESRTLFRNTISIVPKNSHAWRKIVEEEERQRVRIRMLKKTLAAAQARRDRTADLNPSASRVMVLIPPSAPHISSMTKAVTPHGVELTRMGQDDEGKVEYVLRIPTSVTVAFVQDIITQSYKNLKDWSITPRWAWELTQAELVLQFPYDFQFRDVQELSFLADESCKHYHTCWENIKRSEPKGEVGQIMGQRSMRLFDGILLSAEEASSRNWPEDQPRHGTDQLEELMEDARRAHKQIKKDLASETFKCKWARANLNDLEEVPDDDERRRFKFEAKQTNGLIAEGLVPGGSCYDPGMMHEAVVKVRGKLLQKPYHYTPPWQEVAGIARLEITFDDLKFLNHALAKLQEHFEVVWLKNNFRDPTSLGYRGVSLGVRVQVPIGEIEEEPEDEEESAETSEKDSDEDEELSRPPSAALRGGRPEVQAAIAEEPADDERERESGEEEEEEAPKAPVKVVVPTRSHIVQITLMHDKIREVSVGAAGGPRHAISERLLEIGVAFEELQAVEEVLINSLDFTDGMAPCKAALELTNMIPHIRRLAAGIPGNGVQMGQDTVSEVAEQAFAVSADERCGAPTVEEAMRLVSISEEEAKQIEADRRKAAAQEDARIREEAERKKQEAQEKKKS